MTYCVYLDIIHLYSSIRLYIARLFDCIYLIQHTSLLGHHHLDELLVVDLPVTVDVRLSDHLIDLCVCKCMYVCISVCVCVCMYLFMY
jgi:hypothetical protein